MWCFPELDYIIDKSVFTVKLNRADRMSFSVVNWVIPLYENAQLNRVPLVRMTLFYTVVCMFIIINMITVD